MAEKSMVMQEVISARSANVLSEFVVLDRRFVIGQTVIIGGDKCIVLGPSHVDDAVDIFGPEIGTVSVHVCNITPCNEDSHT